MESEEGPENRDSTRTFRGDAEGVPRRLDLEGIRPEILFLTGLDQIWQNRVNIKLEQALAILAEQMAVRLSSDPIVPRDAIAKIHFLRQTDLAYHF